MRARVREKFPEAEWDGLYKAMHPAAQRAMEEVAWMETHADTRTFYNTIVGFGKGFGRVASIADMSCGTGNIARALGEYSNVEPLLGEAGSGYQYEGVLQETVPQIPHVELFILTETLEHLDDPDADLKLIREKTDKLLLSTPMDEGVGNGKTPATGHYWTWGRQDVEAVLNDAGFTVNAFIQLDMTPRLWDHCQFGIWQVI